MILTVIRAQSCADCPGRRPDSADQAETHIYMSYLAFYNVYTYICIYIYIYTHTHMCMYIYIYIYCQ